MFEGDLIRPLGLVALNCGYAEREIDELLNALSYLGPFDPAMRQGTVGQKITLAETLIRDAHQEILLADLLDALAEARRLFEQRNALLHGSLLAGGRLVSHRRGIPDQHVTPEELTHLSESIFACKERIWLERCKHLTADSRSVRLNKPLASAEFSDWMRFSDVPQSLRGRHGVYEVRFDSLTLLKVGMSGDLYRRLSDHARSAQLGLKGPPGPWESPKDVQSKRSILAKHLYFDRSIAPDLNLRTEQGRQAFLEGRCTVRYQVLPTTEAARALEQAMEKAGDYRYLRDVRIRIR
jgi:hypothetical protein